MEDTFDVDIVSVYDHSISYRTQVMSEANTEFQLPFSNEISVLDFYRKRETDPGTAIKIAINDLLRFTKALYHDNSDNLQYDLSKIRLAIKLVGIPPSDVLDNKTWTLDLSPIDEHSVTPDLDLLAERLFVRGAEAIFPPSLADQETLRDIGRDLNRINHNLNMFEAIRKLVEGEANATPIDEAYIEMVREKYDEIEMRNIYEDFGLKNSEEELANMYLALILKKASDNSHDKSERPSPDTTSIDEHTFVVEDLQFLAETPTLIEFYVRRGDDPEQAVDVATREMFSSQVPRLNMPEDTVSGILNTIHGDLLLMGIPPEKVMDSETWQIDFTNLSREDLTPDLNGMADYFFVFGEYFIDGTRYHSGQLRHSPFEIEDKFIQLERQIEIKFTLHIKKIVDALTPVERSNRFTLPPDDLRQWRAKQKMNFLVNNDLLEPLAAMYLAHILSKTQDGDQGNYDKPMASVN